MAKANRSKMCLDSVETKNFISRPYQTELYELCKRQNTIICLETGCGKTFIAVMLVKHLSFQVLDDFEGTGKRTIFLVPEVHLVNQQAEVIRVHTDLRVGEFHGAIVEKFNGENETEIWTEQLKKYQVLVMIHEVFRQLLFSGIMGLDKVNLLIFDEAHWAVKNHPYREIMRCFDTYPPEKRPRVLGLSASLITCKAKPAKTLRLIKNLEEALHSVCETSYDLKAVNRYAAKPDEVVHFFSPFKLSLGNSLKDISCLITQLIEYIKDVNVGFSDDLPVKIKEMSSFLSTTIYIITNMGVWCGREAADLYMKELTDTVEMLASSRSIYTGILSAMQTLMNIIKVSLSGILKGFDKRDQLRNDKLTSPKLLCLHHLLKRYNPNASNENETYPPLCAIIFCERRAVAKILSLWLNEVAKLDPGNFGFIKADSIVGQSGKSNILFDKRQEEALKRFRSHDCNVLASTSVLEEGLDIPRCNLVVRYDVPKTFREYVQSKGRARAEKGKYVVLVEETQEEEVRTLLQDFKNIEKILSKGRNYAADAREKMIAESAEDDKLIQPYIVTCSQARVTLNSAIGLVNRYCLKLPSDSFTKLAPQYTLREVDNGFQCEIRLPINSPVRDTIVGQVMSNKRTAKKAAALEVCKRLHKDGEIDDNLLPVGKEAVKFLDELGLEVSDDEGEKSDRAIGRPGTTKRRQYYYKKVADCLKSNLPKPGEHCYLYVFSMELTCAIPEEQNTRGRKITDPADSPRNFGILTTQKMPLICSFPIFTRSGEVMISFQLTQELKLTAQQIEEVAWFHHFTFVEVLRLVKYPMSFEPKSSTCSFYIVPVIASTENLQVVDWDFVHLIYHQKESPIRALSEEERKEFIFDKEKYLDAVVMPWYRQSNKPQFFFYVAEICLNLTPCSQFPDEGFETFEKYYEAKYKIKIVNLDQPLLDVDHTSARLNLLTPRYVNRKGMTLPTSTAKTKKEKRENLQQKQILIPELCTIHPFPASLWMKAVCLPCILYRLNSLLVAEQLRAKVASEIGVGLITPPANFFWPPLSFGWTLAEVLAKSKDEVLEKKENPDSLFETWDISDDYETPNQLAIESNKPNVTEPPPKPENSENDFVIDEFDPSIYNVIYNDDDDDFMNDLDWDGLGPITLINGSNGMSATGLSSNFSLANTGGMEIREIGDNDSLELAFDSGSLIRMASPSNFEVVDAMDERSWDVDEVQGDVLAITKTCLPGLEYISSTGGLNINDLSKDLANCIDEWDSEYSDLDYSDEDSELEFQPTSKSKASAGQVKQNTIAQLLRYELMSSPKSSPQKSKKDVDFEKLITELEVDESINEQIKEFTETFEKFNFSETGDRKQEADQDKHNDSCDLDKLNELVLKLETEDNDEDLYNEEQKPLEEKVWNGIEESDNEEKQVALNEAINEPLVPNFGELLPNRDNDLNQTSISFKITFDPFKSDDNNVGPSPSIILQALTMSNASDGINLERLETVGDSFLKYAVTAYLYCVCPGIHEGKLSYLRSRQISNMNLYRLGKKIGIGELMNATKFEPNDNWCPPCYSLPHGLEEALIETHPNSTSYDIGMIKNLNEMNQDQIREQIKLHSSQNHQIEENTFIDVDRLMQKIPYNLLTQHSIPDKSIADCVEALIGAYLISCGPKGALLFMKWLGLKVMPDKEVDNSDECLLWHWLPPPKVPLLQTRSPLNGLTPEEKLQNFYFGKNLVEFERKLNYTFKDKAYLVQAFTHNSYYDNEITDCYQRLEFLGDAVLDYLITRYLYEDPKDHSPGTLTDLRSALVNNTFFASLAVKYDFCKYLQMVSFELFRVINAFVQRFRKEDTNRSNDLNLFIAEGECENAEDIEVPKALGDIFESVAGAVYLDSGMSLDVVWEVYFRMMKPEIEYFSTHVPKSPIRELLEMEPQNAKFGKPEIIPGRKIRVCVEVFGEGKFFGIGRNKRIAKCTAAKRALRALKLKRKKSF